MFDRSPDMYDHVNAMVRVSLQLRKELESNRTNHDRAECILLCKAISQHTGTLGALIDATFNEEAFIRELTGTPFAAAPGTVTPVAGFDLAHPDVPPTLKFTGWGGA